MLETERLILRPFTLEDFEAFAAMYADPRVAEFVTEDGEKLEGAVRLPHMPDRDVLQYGLFRRNWQPREQ